MSCLCLSYLIALVAQDVAPMAKPYHYHVVEDHALQRQRVACGPNALYMLLKAHGRAVTYHEVRASLKMREDGCTLLALRNAANRCGLAARVVRCPADALKRLNLPAILHFQKSVHFGDNVKHYVLLTSVSDVQIEYVDGTTGLREAITLKKFAAVSDGYVLERTRDLDRACVSYLMPFAVLMGGLASLRHCFVTMRHGSAGPCPAMIVAVVGFLRSCDGH